MRSNDNTHFTCKILRCKLPLSKNPRWSIIISRFSAFKASVFRKGCDSKALAVRVSRVTLNYDIAQSSGLRSNAFWFLTTRRIAFQSEIRSTLVNEKASAQTRRYSRDEERRIAETTSERAAQVAGITESSHPLKTGEASLNSSCPMPTRVNDRLSVRRWTRWMPQSCKWDETSKTSKTNARRTFRRPVQNWWQLKCTKRIKDMRINIAMRNDFSQTRKLFSYFFFY